MRISPGFTLTVGAPKGVLSARANLARPRRPPMAWTTPVVIETPCGAEINLYISAEI
jgi:coenzyme PQQ precursor peptide PqqA